MSHIDQKNRGSEWRKWDLQVQTVLDDGYVSIDTYWDDLKKAQPAKCQELIDLIGSEELIKQYDSRDYFFTDKTSVNVKCDNYAKLFLNYLDIFVENAGSICLTDHNYEHEHLLDSFIKEAQKTKVKVIAGVEINVQGVHMIILLNTIPFKQVNYSAGIKTLLTKLNVHNRKSTSGALTVSDKSYSDVIKIVEEVGGLLLYPHCNSDNGLFQERGKTDRTHLADQFNAQKTNILQSKNKKSADDTTEYIAKCPNLKSEHIFTLGSDARCLKDVFSQDEFGNYCWVKADTTFDGLKQIAFEHDRVFIGVEPRIFSSVKARPTKFIDSITIDKLCGYDQSQGIWFDGIKVDFNQELVTIIGNKGSGKSALADVLGFLGNTPNYQHFSFLHPKKFKKGNLAGNFEAKLTWASGQADAKNLNENVDLNQPETIKYLPQNYFEHLCNDLNDRTFGDELQQVVFSHLSEDKKFGHKTFTELIDYRAQNINIEIEVLKEEVAKINQDLVALETRVHPDHRSKLENLRKQKELEIKAHEETKPAEIKDPSTETGAIAKQKENIEAITKLNGDIDLLEKEKSTFVEQLSSLSKEIEDLKNFRQSLKLKEKDVLDFGAANQKIIEKYFTSWGKLVTFSVDYKVIDKTINEKDVKLKELKVRLVTSQSLELIEDEKERKSLAQKSVQCRIEEKVKERDTLKKNLDEPARKFQAYLESKTKWENKKKELEGDKNTSATLNYYVAQIEYIDKKLPAIIQQRREERLGKAVEIFNKKKEIIEIYQTVKDSIDEIIKSNQYLLQEYKIILNAGFVVTESFNANFFKFVNQQVKGSFRGREEGEKLLKSVIADINPNNEENIKTLLTKLILLLEEDQRTEVKDEERKKFISDQVSDQAGFFDYLFSLDYLDKSYQLQLDAKNIDTLSPGEKGALLLVFYLMLDKNDIPLVIDQPEDNLDNKSVSRILVPFIKQAKQRRQIIMVTHNPNLAVVADAEEVICVNIDKTDNNRFSLSVGAIETPTINTCIVDILEGTRPAFDKRRLKYNQN